MLVAALDTCPRKSAQALSDQHVRKLILEVAQVLDCGTRNACITLGRPYKQVVAYPKSCPAHPCSIAATYDQAWDWCLFHFGALLDEYESRWWKRHAYDTAEVGDFLCDARAPVTGYRHSYPSPLLAMPDGLQPPMATISEASQARMRNYYVPGKLKWYGKRRPTYARWTNKIPPLWMRESAEAQGWGLIAVGENIYEFREHNT